MRKDNRGLTLIELVVTVNKNTNITADQKIANDSDMDRPLAQSKTLFFGSQSEDGTKSYYSIIWNAEKKTLYYFSQILKQNSGTGTGETSGTGTGGIGGGSSVGTEQVLAKNVTQFAADIHHASDQHTVRFKIVTQVNDREVEKTETVTLRNDVVIAAPGRETAE